MRQVRWAQCAGALCACSVIFPNFFRELLTPIVLIVFFMGSVFQVLHVRPVNIIYYKGVLLVTSFIISCKTPSVGRL